MRIASPLPPLQLEKYVQIGPRAVLRSCHIEEQVRIGARSVIMEGARVCKGAHLQPGTVVPPGRLIPEGEVWGGNPARYGAWRVPHHPTARCAAHA